MALPSITTKVVGSDTVAERKVLYSDINQIKQALQTGALDIKPLEVKMSGTNLYFNDDTVGIRYNNSTNKIQYSDDGSTWNDMGEGGNISTTVTAGENLTTRDLVYFDSSDGKVYKCDADDTAKVDWVGMMGEDVTANNTGTMYTNSAIVGGFTGLTVGANYYVSSTAGEVTTTVGILVGVAVSATQIKLIKQSEEWTLLETLEPTSGNTVSTSASLTNYTNFKIDFVVNHDSGAANFGFSADNTTTYTYAWTLDTSLGKNVVSNRAAFVAISTNSADVKTGSYEGYSDASNFAFHGNSVSAANDFTNTTKTYAIRATTTAKATAFTFELRSIAGSLAGNFQSGTIIRIYAK